VPPPGGAEMLLYDVLDPLDDGDGAYDMVAERGGKV